jgi:glycosyltransferase involved in cell wall biosynthesis
MKPHPLEDEKQREGQGAERVQMKIGILDHLSGKLGGAQLVVAQMAALLVQEHEVEVIHSNRSYTLASLGNAFGVDLGRVRERIIETSNRSFGLPGPRGILRDLPDRLKADRALTKPYDLFIYSGYGVPPFSFARRALIYCHFPFEVCPSERMNSKDNLKQNYCFGRWLRLVGHQGIWNYRMRGYGVILANSFFTAHWVDKMWSKHAEVVYPPVSLNVPSAEKTNTIVSIGRFIDSTNSKSHAHQLKAFADFLGRAKGDWRLCLIGFCTFEKYEEDYLRDLRAMAEGMPVTFVVNAERSVVLRHLAEAKLFWHTAGITDCTPPAPSQMEHFGIATVEAMLAGCIPLVPAHGGQVEIVEDGLSGFLCHNTKELVEYTDRLAQNECLREDMSRRAVTRGQTFNLAVFQERINRIVSGCLKA